MQKPATMSQQSISIVGAGLGGLTLGRCLLKHGVPAVSYERASNSPRHGYGVTLHDSTYGPLLKILGTDEWAFRRLVSVDGPRGGDGSIDSALVAHPGKVGSGSFRAHREKLETLRREGLDVRWEHAIEKVEETPVDIALCTQNGQKTVQKCIIGVDGPHSRTRLSLLPQLGLNVLPLSLSMVRGV